MENDQISSMLEKVKNGGMSRRKFVKTAMLSGVTASVAAQMLASAGLAEPSATDFPKSDKERARNPYPLSVLPQIAQAPRFPGQAGKDYRMDGQPHGFSPWEF